MSNITTIRKQSDRASIAVRKTHIEPPAGISKSLVKAMGCETYFVGQYLQRSQCADAEHPLARTGTDFHDWRKDYVTHLVDSGRWSDPYFVDDWLVEHKVSEDARKLILTDAQRFRCNPEAVYGSEIFLSISKSFEPLEHIVGRAPGSLSTHPDFLLSGQLDLVLLDGTEAIVIDPKSGWSITGVTDDEPAFYALLLFVHLPHLQSVRFEWDFVRKGLERRAIFDRHDIGWIKERVAQANEHKNDILARANAQQALRANPMAGLCAYCHLTCPLRPRADAGDFAIGPLQNESDATKLAQIIKVCETFLDQARPMLVSYLDQAHFGEIPLGNNWVATVQSSAKNEYPLIDALDVLGLGIVDLSDLDARTRRELEEQRPLYSPAFDVPLSQLCVSGLSSFAKTKKSKRRGDAGGVSREGMRPALDQIANASCSSRLQIRQAIVTIEDDASLEALLQRSLEAAPQ